MRVILRCLFLFITLLEVTHAFHAISLHRKRWYGTSPSMALFREDRLPRTHSVQNLLRLSSSSYSSSSSSVISFQPSLWKRVQMKARKVLQKVRVFVSTVCLAMLLAFTITSPAKAAPSSRRGSEKVVVVNNNRKTTTASKASPPASTARKGSRGNNQKVQVEIVAPKKQTSSFMVSNQQKLNLVGGLLVVLSVVYAVLGKDESALTKEQALQQLKKKKANKLLEAESELEKEEEVEGRSLKLNKKKYSAKTSSTDLEIGQQVNQKRDWRKSVLPKAEDILEEDETIDDILENPTSAPSRPVSPKVSSSIMKKIAKKAPSASVERLPHELSTELDNPVADVTSSKIVDAPIPAVVPPFATLMEIPEDALPVIPPVQPPVVEEVPLPPPEPKKPGGLLGRLFQKAGSGRPAEIKNALEVQDETKEYRKLVAAFLQRYLPQHIHDSLEIHLSARSERIVNIENDEDAMKAIVESYQSIGLQPQQAAEVFAEVTNAIMVLLVDEAAGTADDKNEERSLNSLDVIAEFVDRVGYAFSQIVPGIRVEPIQYNGKSKKGKLETLYTRYAKFTMADDSMFAKMFNMPTEGSQPEDSASATEEQDLQQLMEQRMASLQKLQFIFDIKEAKRNSIEQKIMRDLVMSKSKEFAGAGGGGGGGGLGGLMDAFTGKGGANAMPSMEEFNKIMEGMPAGSGGMPEGMPDLSKLKPEEMASYLTEVLQGLDQAMDRGELTLPDILEFEKVTGMDFETLAKQIDSPQARQNPSIRELGKVFKRVATLKKTLKGQ